MSSLHTSLKLRRIMKVRRKPCTCIFRCFWHVRNVKILRKSSTSSEGKALPKGFVKKWEENLIEGVRAPPQIERESQVGTTLKILTKELETKFEATDKEAQKILKEAQAVAEQRRKKSL